ncbi:hypothetical protein BS50DRAFT_632352 [Corynespora cassiicola Philippines]|uniref:NACHT domain-containing protein n=1 Tax=Corynespora cassiicola Philippines TaxID=1448308 RepID=A0A2T2NYH3_CORCC|nr:hypothetical protein BS50DRAFT_632352 [Corynespora cassiicola Philippines]
MSFGWSTSDLALAAKFLNVKGLEKKLGAYQPTMGRLKVKGFKDFVRGSYKKVEYAVFVAKQVQNFRERISHQLHDLQLNLDLSSTIDTQLSALEANLGRQTAQLADIQQKNKAELLSSTLKEIMPGSCDWIFAKQEYNKWLPAVNHYRPSFLWVLAILGAGKTFPATQVIRKLSEQYTVAYFYCEARTEQSRHTTNILCTLLWQLLRKHEDALADAIDEYSSGAEPHKESVKKIIRKVLEMRPNVVTVLDGLDECCSTTVKEISEFMISLLGHTSVLLSSRVCMYTEDVMTKIPPQHHISRLQIEDTDTASDITRFIARELDTLPSLEYGEKGEVAEALQGRAQGMFLWVDLAVKQLKSGGGVDVDDYLTQIGEMPQDLDEYYGRLLQNLHTDASEASKRRSKVIFQWLVCAQRSLTVSELAVAVKLKADEPRLVQRRTFHLEELKSAVHHRCGPMAKFIDSAPEAIVTLIHATARDFLLRYDRVNGPFKGLLVNAAVTHIWIARSCLTYLCYLNTKFPPMNLQPPALKDRKNRQVVLDQEFAALLSDYPLLEYAALHWADHFQFSDYNPDLYHNLRTFCLSEASTIKWLQIYLRLRGDRGLFRTSRSIQEIRKLEEIGLRLRGTPFDQSFQTWLEHLSGPSDGRFERWERFLSSGDANDYLPALHVAAFFDLDHFTQLALDQGSDVN